MTDLGDSKDDAQSLLDELKEFTNKSMVSCFSRNELQHYLLVINIITVTTNTLINSAIKSTTLDVRVASLVAHHCRSLSWFL